MREYTQRVVDRREFMLPWAQVGVFRKTGPEGPTFEIDKKDITGKFVEFGQIVTTMTKQYLRAP